MGWQDAPVVEQTGSSKWMSAPEVSPSESPGMGSVALNAVAKGAAAIPDMFLNAPVNAYNLGKAGVGYAADKLGRPDILQNMEITPTPNFAHRGMSAMGLIKPEHEPHTTGQRMADTAIQGGVGMLVGPGSAIKNAATGLLGGTAAQATKEITGSDTAAIAAGGLTPFALRAGNLGTHPSANPVRDATLKEGQAAGYVVPPSSVNPSFFNNRMESIAGKAAVGQDAAARNQAVTNALAAKALGLPPDTAMTEGVLNTVRTTAAAPYRAVSSLSPVASSALEKLKETRAEASGFWKHYDRSADPKSLAEAKALSQKAEMYETAIEKIASRSGQPDLVDQLREARTTIAKSYDIERALNLGDANVSAPMIGRQLDKAGVKAKSGELATIGKMSEAFPQVMREGARVPTAGVSGTDAAASALLGTMGYGAAGPVGIGAAALPLLRGPARAMVLSDTYQQRMARPGTPPPPMSETALRSLLLQRAIADRNQGVQ